MGIFKKIINFLFGKKKEEQPEPEVQILKDVCSRPLTLQTEDVVEVENKIEEVVEVETNVEEVKEEVVLEESKAPTVKDIKQTSKTSKPKTEKSKSKPKKTDDSKSSKPNKKKKKENE